ncbi:MAG: hypothetical protein AAF802_24965 [Planctomycetota bacterium]
MKSTFFATILALFVLASPASSQDAVPKKLPTTDTDEARWERVVGLQTKLNNDTRFASGFLVEEDDDIYLVTAKHAANETNGETRLLFVNRQGVSRWFLLRGLFVPGKSPWVFHDHADLAVAKLAPPESTEETMQAMRDVTIDIDRFADDLPKRTTEIEFVGFPMAKGIGPNMSALVIPGHLVSKELSKKGDWGQTPIAYAVPAVGAGASGSPAYDVTATPPRVIGVYVAVTQDKTGAKLSELVPARLVLKLIQAW